MKTYQQFLKDELKRGGHNVAAGMDYIDIVMDEVEKAAVLYAGQSIEKYQKYRENDQLLIESLQRQLDVATAERDELAKNYEIVLFERGELKAKLAGNINTDWKFIS
jgi:hypothetical protein